MGPGSAEQREGRCTASGTRAKCTPTAFLHQTRLINLQRCHSVPRTQRSAQRCAAEPGSTLLLSMWVPALRSNVKDVAPRPGHERNLLSPPCGDLPVGRLSDRAVYPPLQKIIRFTRRNTTHPSCPDLIRHPSIFNKVFRRRWIAGSSPAMTASDISRALTYSASSTAFAISAVPLLPPNSIGLIPAA